MAGVSRGDPSPDRGQAVDARAGGRAGQGLDRVADPALALGRGRVGREEAGQGIFGQCAGQGIDRGEGPGDLARGRIEAAGHVDEDARPGPVVHTRLERLQSGGHREGLGAEAEGAPLEGAQVQVGVERLGDGHLLGRGSGRGEVLEIDRIGERCRGGDANPHRPVPASQRRDVPPGMRLGPSPATASSPRAHVATPGRSVWDGATGAAWGITCRIAATPAPSVLRQSRSVYALAPSATGCRAATGHDVGAACAGTSGSTRHRHRHHEVRGAGHDPHGDAESHPASSDEPWELTFVPEATLCGRPHKVSYVAQSVMWRPAGFVGVSWGRCRAGRHIISSHSVRRNAMSPSSCAMPPSFCRPRPHTSLVLWPSSPDRPGHVRQRIAEIMWRRNSTKRPKYRLRNELRHITDCAT
jgi:hypothetical protein